MSTLLGTHHVATPEEMETLGAALGATLSAGDLVVLTGPLGAGKTTLTRGIGAGLGVRGPIASPTFVLARTHPSPAGGPALTHVDAYRLAGALELDDLDLDYAGSVVVVEWGAGMLEGVAEEWLEVEIERPRGASPGVGSAPVAAGDGERATEQTPEQTPEQEEAVLEAPEPRLVTIRSHTA